MNGTCWWRERETHPSQKPNVLLGRLRDKPLEQWGEKEDKRSEKHPRDPRSHDICWSEHWGHSGKGTGCLIIGSIEITIGPLSGPKVLELYTGLARFHCAAHPPTRYSSCTRPGTVWADWSASGDLNINPSALPLFHSFTYLLCWPLLRPKLIYLIFPLKLIGFLSFLFGYTARDKFWSIPSNFHSAKVPKKFLKLSNILNQK